MSWPSCLFVTGLRSISAQAMVLSSWQQRCASGWPDFRSKPSSSRRARPGRMATRELQWQAQRRMPEHGNLLHTEGGSDPCRASTTPRGHTAHWAIGQRQRVHLPRHGSVGISTRCDTGLLTARQANGLCVHRGIQLQAAERVPECSLVPFHPGRLRKVGDMAETLQRGTTTQRNRKHPSDNACKISWRYQPANLTKRQNSRSCRG